MPGDLKLSLKKQNEAKTIPAHFHMRCFAVSVADLDSLMADGGCAECGSRSRSQCRPGSLSPGVPHPQGGSLGDHGHQ